MGGAGTDWNIASNEFWAPPLGTFGRPGAFVGTGGGLIVCDGAWANICMREL